MLRLLSFKFVLARVIFDLLIRDNLNNTVYTLPYLKNNKNVTLFHNVLIDHCRKAALENPLLKALYN